jgi:D-2-hydroxyacid dehydrogenase (NADP+)
MRVLVGGAVRPADETELRSAFPAIDFVRADTPDDALAVAPTIDATIGLMVTADFVRGAERLRWVQIRPAGVNALPLDDLAERGVIVTNGRGVHSGPVAETAMTLLLACTTGLLPLIAAKQRHEWISGRMYSERRELGTQTILIAGLGDIGRTLAARVAALGTRVLGYDLIDKNPPPGVVELVAEDRLIPALGEVDHVVLILPLTPDTHGWFDEAKLRAMKPTAYLHNVGRGPLVDREALLRALREGWIAGAGLDVTVPEPLPPDDPLWDMPNVLLTQHTAGGSPSNDGRILAIYKENLRRLLAGAELLNLVDCRRGF